jgi:hypothetical protein
MVWGAVRNPTRLSGEPSEGVAGVPPGLRPMPFLTACVRHAEGGVGRGPRLRAAVLSSCTGVCCAGVLVVLLPLLFCRCCLFAGSVRRSVFALLLLLRCPLPCRCACCCVCFVVPVRCASSSSSGAVGRSRGTASGRAQASTCRSDLFSCRVSLPSHRRSRDATWLKMRMQIAAGARKQRSSCGCGGSVLLLALSPHHPTPPASKRLGRKTRSHEGKWKAALGMAHRRIRSPLFAVQARNQSWKDQAPLLLS